LIIPAVAAALNYSIAHDAGCALTPPMCGSAPQSALSLFDVGISCTAASAADVCPPEASACDVTGTGSAPAAWRTAWQPRPDGAITAAELENNNLIRSLFTPDVDLLDANGTFQENPARRDGLKDALSVGVHFTCAPAAFAVPGE